jgi:hypothetical protein
MRIFVLLLCLVTPAFTQSSSSQDSKSLYNQAMNKLMGSAATRSDLTGLDLMSRSADAGYEPAQVALGVMYESGSFVAASPAKAADYYRKAADQGSNQARYLLGRLYYLNLLSGGRREGERWLQNAADEGNPFAAYYLGLSLYDRDPAAGIKQFRAAAEQGLPYAQYRLGKALIDGRVPVNKREAYLWMFVAHDAGVTEAATDMSILESDLGQSGAESAKSEARDMEQRVRRAANARQCTGWDGELSSLPTPPPIDILRYCE